MASSLAEQIGEAYEKGRLPAVEAFFRKRVQDVVAKEKQEWQFASVLDDFALDVVTLTLNNIEKALIPQDGT